jgi:hypothetical protein
VRDRLPRAIYGYVAHGSETETSLRSNVAYGGHTEKVHGIGLMIDSGFWHGTGDLKFLALGALFMWTRGHAPVGRFWAVEWCRCQSGVTCSKPFTSTHRTFWVKHSRTS